MIRLGDEIACEICSTVWVVNNDDLDCAWDKNYGLTCSVRCGIRWKSGDHRQGRLFQ